MRAGFELERARDVFEVSKKKCVFPKETGKSGIKSEMVME